MIVVTGATGRLGRLVVEALSRKMPPAEIAVAVRDPGKVTMFAARGITVRYADYSRPDTLRPALAGAENVLLISSSELDDRVTQHQHVIAAAQQAGVKLFAYTSLLHADTARMALASQHRATEAAIQASGLPFVFLRNGRYLENYTCDVVPALERGFFAGSAGGGKIAAAARADYAAAAAEVLTGEGHANHVYELAGDAAFTMSELAAELSRQTGRAVEYRDLPRAEYERMLVAFGVPIGAAGTLAESDEAIRCGELDDGSGDLRRLIGRPTVALADAVALALTRARLVHCPPG